MDRHSTSKPSFGPPRTTNPIVPAPNRRAYSQTRYKRLDDEFRRKARALRFLCQDIGELRRGDHYAERLQLDLERFAETNKEDQLRAFELALAETKQWPEVQQAFNEA